MKNSNFFWNAKNQKCEIWHEEVNGNIDYWIKEDGITRSLTKKNYEMMVLFVSLTNG